MSAHGQPRSVASGAVSPEGSALVVSAEACDGCGACVAECPSGALSVVDGVAETRAEACVACGRCLSVCPASAITTRDGLPKVRELLTGDAPVVVLLAAESAVALFPLEDSELQAALCALGFARVEHTTLGEELVAKAYERRFAGETYRPTLRSTCPVVVEWVRRYHPSLVPALAPLVPPHVAQARLIKTLYPAGTSVVYVSPCFARKAEAESPELAGSVDAVIDFVELGRLLKEGPESPGAEPAPPKPRPRRRVSIHDGFPRSALTSFEPTSGDLYVARAIDAVDDVLRAIESAECAPLVLDLLGCDSCLSGSAVNTGRSLFAKRRIDARARFEAEARGADADKLLQYLPKVELVRSFSALASEPYAPVPRHPAERPEKRTAPEALPVVKEPLEEAEPPEEPEASVDLDPSRTPAPEEELLDLLMLETARNRRYGAPLSLLMTSLRGDDAVPDDEGYVSRCDGKLESFCTLVAGNVRATDSVRIAGHCEVALILPGIGKTRAFLVAERLRDIIRGLPGRPRLAIGVASLGGRIESGEDLRRAATVAMREAAAGDGDTTRIAGNRGE